MTQPASISSPVVLITGATAGIGRHAALYLADRGYRVFAAGRNRKALAELAELGRANLTPLSLDVTDPESIAAARAAINSATDGHGVDALVNNAGYGDIAPLEMQSDADIRKQYETNVFGLMAVTRAFLPDMRDRGAGRLVNISSIGGRFTLPLFGAYNSTKYAVESLSDALRLELRPFGIRVAIVEPGVIRSKFSDHAIDAASKYQDPSSPYAPVVERFATMTRKSDRMAADPIVTSRAIHAAIASRRPRARYVVPFWRGRVGVGLVRRLPTFLVDAVMRRTVGLTRKHLGLGDRPTAQLEGSRA